MTVCMETVQIYLETTLPYHKVTYSTSFISSLFQGVRTKSFVRINSKAIVKTVTMPTKFRVLFVVLVDIGHYNYVAQHLFNQFDIHSITFDVDEQPCSGLNPLMSSHQNLQKTQPRQLSKNGVSFMHERKQRQLFGSYFS